MRVAGRVLAAAAFALAASFTAIGAQQSSDPRVGLKPGLRNAAHAARNMELVASLPKPQSTRVQPPSSSSSHRLM